MTRLVLIALVAAAGVWRRADAYYLPGVAPKEFAQGEKVELKVNKLTSTRTHLPYDYYSQKFCKPVDGIKMAAENLGEFLTGDRIENSPYELKMLTDEYCKLLCQVTLGTREAASLRRMVNEEYHHNWIIDNLPAASVIDNDQYITTSYSRGFPIGYKLHEKSDIEKRAKKGNSDEAKSTTHYLYNHVNVIVKYHEIDADMYRVVGFYVEPFSIKHEFEIDMPWDPKTQTIEEAPPLTTCSTAMPVEYETIAAPQPIEKGKVIFTYDVLWKESNIHWASRWDIYLSMDNAVPDKVHWFSIVNSVLIVLFLTAMIAMILIRNIHRDISRYNRIPTDEEKAEEREETGWKLVHADVFRPPQTAPMMLCVFVGTGIQLLVMATVTIAFAAVGFLSPSNRGALLIAMLLFYVVAGAFAGYFAANLYKTFRGKQWQKLMLATAFGYPSLCFILFMGLDVMEKAYGSSAAVPILTVLALLALWFGISVPLVFLGAFIGFRKAPIEFPNNTSKVPKHVPDQPWYLATPITVLAGGVLPFGACFVELFFILSSIWMDQYYYVYGFLVLVALVLVITCAEITVVLLYFQLCAEDYQWWWRSFLTSGSTALYVFLYSAFYFSKLETNMTITYVMYFGYMGIVCIGIFLLTGTVGLGASLWFTKVIYSTIKVE